MIFDFYSVFSTVYEFLLLFYSLLNVFNYLIGPSTYSVEFDVFYFQMLTLDNVYSNSKAWIRKFYVFFGKTYVFLDYIISFLRALGGYGFSGKTCIFRSSGELIDFS